MIAIIDYGMGNLKSVAKAFEKVGATVSVTRDPQKIKDAHKVVLPGVGAFPKCMENLAHYSLTHLISEQIKNGKWFLGICLGLQLLFEESEEFGPVQGLSILKGKVVRFQNLKKIHSLKIPHMGWNQIKIKNTPVLFKDIADNSYFYFVHSYYGVPRDESSIATTTDYGISFCSSIEKDNILATQFHPEKSQKLGLDVLKNFIEL